jgi:hypothetical protein
VSEQQADRSRPQPQAQSRSEPVSCADPAELARRRLVEWCVRHELPVPVEPQIPAKSRR